MSIGLLHPCSKNDAFINKIEAWVHAGGRRGVVRKNLQNETESLSKVNASRETNNMPYLVIFKCDGAFNLSEALAVLDATDCAFLELHHIVSESACFVTENILNLS